MSDNPEPVAKAADRIDRAIDLLKKRSGDTSTPRITSNSTGVLFTEARRLAKGR